MTVKLFQFLAIVVSALAMIPAGAHLAALPNKIGMPRSAYFTVQGIYQGWFIWGWLWPIALIVHGVLAYLVRAQTGPFWFALLSGLGFALALTIFYIWPFPANRVTRNWTVVPENWKTLRRQWEYSHAVNTAILFVAVCSATIGALSWRSS
jgi:hypothetical protein